KRSVCDVLIAMLRQANRIPTGKNAAVHKLHNQCHRIHQPPGLQSHQIQGLIPNDDAVYKIVYMARKTRSKNGPLPVTSGPGSRVNSTFCEPMQDLIKQRTQLF
ncbi:MAG TPA: hypothetical protein PLV25_07930, partial [Opitutales bacterium]|nr:hypothetical protein [Opitutales bacterium]